MPEAEQLFVSSVTSTMRRSNCALWLRVLEKICRFVGGSAAVIWARDAALRTGTLHHQVGFDPRWEQAYLDRYIKLDPASAAYLVLDAGVVYSNSQLIPQAEFLELARFYKEWAGPQGWIDNVCVILEKSGTTRAEHGVLRHERDGLADEPARRRMRLIVPHIRRAVLIARLIDLKAAEAATFADALDGFSAGMFLVDARGRIVHANAAGHAMVAEGSVLSAAGRKLAANDTNAEQALHEVFLAAANGDAAVGIKGIAVPLTASGGERWVAHVLPLTSGARRRAGTSYAAVAALFVHKAALATPSPPEVIARTFKLTPSELRVLLAIVEVGGVPETAEALGIAETTVKTHLRHLYAKTGTGRQAELVKLVAGFSSPLVG